MAKPDIYKSNIIGPIHSRRLGISLGVNLLPADGKICSFDCLYCECGWNADHRGGRFPKAVDVMQQLEEKLSQMKADGEALDVITFAGNGEPTLHPEFAEVIDRTIDLRDEFYPNAKVSVLSNATQIGNENVRNALLRVDNNILKIDGAFDATVRLIDQPSSKDYSIRQVVEGMKEFKGQLIVQTMFVRGEHDGQTVDNTTDEEVSAWRDLMREIRPHQIMAYSLDRPTPEPDLIRVSREEMTGFVQPLIDEGMNVTVS
ncbi:MAG: radical SAM protein [Bacteroidales bacterium]|nr:radical SAM protein [Candidatus Liminaster caballi]